jgi:hypothetical protein
VETLCGARDKRNRTAQAQNSCCTLANCVKRKSVRVNMSLGSIDGAEKNQIRSNKPLISYKYFGVYGVYGLEYWCIDPIHKQYSTNYSIQKAFEPTSSAKSRQFGQRERPRQRWAVLEDKMARGKEKLGCRSTGICVLARFTSPAA